MARKLKRRLRLYIYSGCLICAIIAYMLFVPKENPRSDLEGNKGAVLADVETIHDCFLARLMDMPDAERGQPDEQLIRNIVQKYRDDFSRLKMARVTGDGRISDRNGETLRIKVVKRGSSTEKPAVRVWSIGKNRIDENGNGDDILSRRE